MARWRGRSQACWMERLLVVYVYVCALSVDAQRTLTVAITVFRRKCSITISALLLQFQHSSSSIKKRSNPRSINVILFRSNRQRCRHSTTIPIPRLQSQYPFTPVREERPPAFERRHEHRHESWPEPERRRKRERRRESGYA